MTPPRVCFLLLGCVIVALVAGAGAEDAKEARAPAEARTLHMFSTELPDDLNEQAQRALERDAWRREWRFLDATRPGTLFGATRVAQAEIDDGLWPSVALYELGAQLFHLPFTPDLGFGGRDTPGILRVHRGRRGGPDARSCAECHARGGPAGAGDASSNAYLDGDGATQRSALARNAIPLHGAGLVELLAAEMSAELATARARLLKQARERQTQVRGEVVAKGVGFGFLTAHRDGSVDTGEVVGVDSDLVIKPFGWKGSFATLREVIEEELLVHHGMQSGHVATTAPAERAGPYGAPDPDGDGVINEIDEGQVTALTLYLAMQEVPQIEPPASAYIPVTLWAQGRKSFEELGCGTCHAFSLPLDRTVYALPRRTGGPKLQVDLARHGAAPRIAPPEESGPFRVYLLSDLKRHDLGPALAEARPDRGVSSGAFLTRPLWGLARSRPYLHDARAPTFEEAILLHDGEARAARDRYVALSKSEQAPLRVFLTSLTRARRVVAD